jgi:chromosome segregation ATPase
MNGLTGMEKFSHLEDKIYLTIEFTKKLREEKEKVEREAVTLRRDAASLMAENTRLEEKVEKLLSERDAIQLKVEAMLEAMSTIDSEVAEAVGRQQHA